MLFGVTSPYGQLAYGQISAIGNSYLYTFDTVDVTLTLDASVPRSTFLMQGTVDYTLAPQDFGYLGFDISSGTYRVPFTAADYTLTLGDFSVKGLGTPSTYNVVFDGINYALVLGEFEVKRSGRILMWPRVVESGADLHVWSG